jgi:cyclopropane fatty-acyl-phospholipid synthase-like methyltransferase
MSAADYDRWRQPERVLGALDLRPEHSVADIGAGRGYLSLRIAAALGPRGRVTATDIDSSALDHLRAELHQRPHLAPIDIRLVGADDPGLEAGAYDRILLAQVDHLLAHRRRYLTQLVEALAPGGRLAIANRVQRRAGVITDANAAGLHRVATVEGLPGQFMFVFERSNKESQ